MELEFDKEIDAILRKGREAVGVSGPVSSHLDADTISAFAENALPQKARLLYMEHLADCSPCRKHLTFAAQMSDERPAAPVAVPVLAATNPWYQSLFRTPNLALAMGALVLTFGGVFGYLMLQNSQRDQNATVSQVSEQEQQPGGPFLGDETEISNTNAAAPLANAATTTNANANMTAPNGRLSGNTANTTAPPAGEALVTMAAPPVDEVAKPQPLREAEAQPPPKPAPPPAATMDGVTAEAEKKSDDDKAREVKDLGSRKRMESRRDSPPPAAKTGPSRSGPLQNQSNNSLYQMSVTRTAGGKTFTNRDGAWYDSAYRGQATENYRRGAVEYKKLDSSLRKIADTIGGTVVVVWKEKAYRIQ